MVSEEETTAEGARRGRADSGVLQHPSPCTSNQSISHIRRIIDVVTTTRETVLAAALLSKTKSAFYSAAVERKLAEQQAPMA